jgi:hypothetical protein
MQRKSSNQRQSQKAKELSLDIEHKTKFWQPVVKNGWWMKFSTYRDHYILLMVISTHTCQTIIRYYEDEQDAVQFINFITACDSQSIFQSA